MILPLNAKPYTNIENLGNQGIAAFIDCAKDDAMNNIPRAGLGGASSDCFVDLSANSIMSLYEWESQGVMVAVDNNGKIYKVNKFGVKTEITGATLTGGFPVSFADYGGLLYMANGGKIISWDIEDTTCAELNDPDAPVVVTHIAITESRLLAKEGNEWLVSEALDPSDWQGIEYSAEAKPDSLQAVHADWEEVALFGSDTTEFWSGTGNPNDPFQRNSGSSVEHGTISPYSIELFDNSYWFLDYMRRVVRLAIRQPLVVSNPIDNLFQKMSEISDCRGLHLPVETTVVFTFPTEGKSYAYDYKRDVWGEWTYLNDGVRERYLGNCACYMRAWNKQLVGSRNSGKIYVASKDYTSDGGNELIPLLRTGSLNGGTQAWKVPKGPNALVLRVKRGQVVNPAIEPFMTFRYRKDGFDWSLPKTINLGRGGEMNPIGKVRALGRARTMEFEFSWDASALTALVSAEVNL